MILELMFKLIYVAIFYYVAVLLERLLGPCACKGPWVIAGVAAGTITYLIFKEKGGK